MKSFYKYSSPKIIIDKTKAKYIGQILKPHQFPHRLSLIKILQETLGIVITNVKDKHLHLYFTAKYLNH